MARSYKNQYPRFSGEADCLIHYGISGQKWGKRRYQNEDGTLTEEGKRRYGESGNGILSTQEKKKPWYVKDESQPKPQHAPGTIVERSDNESKGGLRSLLENRRLEKMKRRAELEPGKNLHEVSDEGLAKRRENVDKVLKKSRIQSVFQAAMGVSLAVAGSRMTKKYPGGWGQLLKMGGIGYVLGTGVGLAIGEGAGIYAKNLLNKEETRRKNKQSGA